MARRKLPPGANRSTGRPVTTEKPDYLGKIEALPVDQLKPNPRNARTHSKKQIRQIARSIERFQFLNPILIDENNVVLAGHGRLAAARLLGLKTVPTIKLSHLSDAEKRSYVIADNKIALAAGWDRSMLEVELGELAYVLPEIDPGLDITITGFSVGEVDSILVDHEAEHRDPADTLGPMDHPIVSMRGDLWCMGDRSSHRLLCGDAQSSEAMAQLMGGKSAAMVMTDPPYNVRVNGHVGGRGKTKHSEFVFASGEMTQDAYRAFLAVVIQLMVVASRGGTLIYIFIDWRHVEDALQTCRSLGLQLRDICVWNKTSPGQGSLYRSAHELVVVCQVDGGEATNNIELGRHGRNRTNVWTYPGVNTFRTSKDDDYALHPTVKPVALIAEAIKDASPRGGIILDPFLGSGTTLLACEKVGRRCYGLEYEPVYVDTAIRRWQQFAGQDAILVGCADDGDAFAALVGLTFDEVGRQRAELAIAASPSAPEAEE